VNAPVPAEDTKVLVARGRRLQTLSFVSLATSAGLFVLTLLLPGCPIEGGGCLLPWWVVSCGLSITLLVVGIVLFAWASGIRRMLP